MFVPLLQAYSDSKIIMITKTELKKSLKEIFVKLQNPMYSWEGLIELKKLDVNHFKDILVYVKHPFWLVSWAILDKIADFDDESAIPFLFPYLKHPDPQVKQKVQEVITMVSSTNFLYFIKKLDHKDYRIRTFATNFLKAQGLPIIQYLSSQVGKHSWVISNRLVQIIWEVIGPKKSTVLATFLSIQSVQRHTIMLMALSKNKRCIEPIIKLYKVPRLKQHILLAINSFGINEASPVIIQSLLNPKYKQLAKELLQKLGSPVVPHLIKASISKKEHYKDIMRLLETIPFTMNQYITLEEKYFEKKDMFEHLNPISRFEPHLRTNR